MNFSLALNALLLFVGLAVTENVFHRYPRFSLAFFSIASIILFPCWVFLIGVEDWFVWLKVLSVASGIIILSLLRTTKLGRKVGFLRWITYAVLAINVFEASFRDVVAGNPANYLNAAAGFLLIATLEKIHTIHIDKKKKCQDLYWSGMTVSWIIGYTLWNWVFLYLNFGFQNSIAHIAVLGSALIIIFTHKERWLQARAFTLGMYFILFHTLPHLSPNLIIDKPNDQLGLFLSLASFGFMLAYTIFFVRRRGARLLAAFRSARPMSFMSTLSPWRVRVKTTAPSRQTHPDL